MVDVAAPRTPAAPAAPAHAAELCVTCGRPAGTPYCPHCGERRASDHPYTVRGAAAESWDLVTPADGRALRSLWVLVRRPGALTAAYMRGERRPYLPPPGLFLLVNGAYFVYTGVTGQHVFDTPLHTHLNGTAHSALARRLVERRLVERRETLAAYARRFDRVVETQSKSLIVAIVPGFALLAAALALPRRRPALHHVAFAFHGMAALLLSFVALTALVLYPVAYAAHWLRLGRPLALSEGAASAVLVAPFYGWLVLALRRAYGYGPVAAAYKAVALLAGLLVVLFAYRALLFFTAFWAT